MWAVGWGLSIDNVITRRLLRGKDGPRTLLEYFPVYVCMCVFAFEIVRDTCAKGYDLLLGSLRGRCGLLPDAKHRISRSSSVSGQTDGQWV